jgi:hypothetical protein
MGRLEDLRAELDAGHPDTGAYDANDALAADQINVVNRSVNRDTMEATEVLQAVVPAEYTVLAADKKAELFGLLGMGTLNPFGKEADLMIDIFGAGSSTIAALAVLRKRAVSRAEELGLGKVRAGTVAQARAL